MLRQDSNRPPLDLQSSLLTIRPIRMYGDCTLYLDRCYRIFLEWHLSSQWCQSLSNPYWSWAASSLSEQLIANGRQSWGIHEIRALEFSPLHSCSWISVREKTRVILLSQKDLWFSAPWDLWFYHPKRLVFLDKLKSFLFISNRTHVLMGSFSSHIRLSDSRFMPSAACVIWLYMTTCVSD